MKLLSLNLASALLLLAPLTTQAQLQDSPWPMFHHDLRHTGESPYVGPETPTLKWTYSTGSVFRSSAAVGADGTIYVGCCDRTLYAINADGTLKWSFPTGGDIWSSPAIGSDGTVYAGSVGDSSLYAIDSTGNLKWRYRTGYHIFSSPAIAPDGTIYIGSRDCNLYAINPEGTLKWAYPTGGPIYSSPAIGADSTIYVGSDDCDVYAINPDGTLKWSYATDSTVRSSPAIGTDGTTYIKSDDGGLYAISPDGTLNWLVDSLFRAGGLSYFTSSPAIDRDGTIYIGSFKYPTSQGLFAFHADGTLKWLCPINGVNTSSPAVDSNKTVYIGSALRHLYAVDSTGTVKWDFPTPGGDIYASPAVDCRTIYIGTTGASSSEFFAIGFLRDVSPISIVSPGDSVYIDSTHNPRAVVKNLGDTLETFDVACMIDTAGQSVYGDTSTVSDLPVGDTALVSFEGWMVGPDPGVSYTVTVVTLLGPDYRPQNDTLSKVTVSIPLPGVEELNYQLPMANGQLFQNWPNPFSHTTLIELKVKSEKSKVSLKVYDLAGRLIKTLVDDSQSVTSYESPVAVRWDGRDGLGRPVGSGVYFYRLSVSGQGGEFVSTKKMMLVR